MWQPRPQATPTSRYNVENVRVALGMRLKNYLMCVDDLNINAIYLIAFECKFQRHFLSWEHLVHWLWFQQAVMRCECEANQDYSYYGDGVWILFVGT